MVKRVNKFRHKEKIDHKKLHIIGTLSFLMGFAAALLAYVTSTYISTILETDNIGIIYLIAYAIVLILLLNLHKLVRIFGKSFVLQAAFVLKITAIAGLLFFQFSIISILFLMLYIIAGVLAWTSLDGIVESFSKDSESGRIRGAHLAVANAGFLMGPLLSSQILDRYGFNGVFLLVFIVYSVILIVAMLGIRKTNHKFKEKVKVIDLLKKVSKRKNIMRVYYLSFVLEFFYAMMVIYAPLYLLEKGFTWDQLGIAFTIMLIPFALIQYPAGVLADKKTGEKEFLLFSFMILGISTLIFYFTDSSDILVWTTILLLGRIGAALAEILRESYFYKRIDGDNVDIIDFFKTAKPVAYMMATALSTLILIFFNIRSVFLLVAIVSFSAIIPALKLVDNKSEKEILEEKKA